MHSWREKGDEFERLKTCWVEPSDDVNILKGEVSRTMAVAEEHVRLIFNGKPLLLDKTLEDYNIQAGCELDLQVRGPGGMGKPGGTSKVTKSKVNKVRFFCFFSLFVTLVLQSNFPPCVCVLLRLPRPISAQAFL